MLGTRSGRRLPSAGSDLSHLPGSDLSRLATATAGYPRANARRTARDRMSRVLVTGGAGTIGTAIVRRLLSDPAYDVRVSDARAVPLWMREGCELHTGDLRSPVQARAATKGCSHVIHLAMADGGIATARAHPHTTIESEAALHGAVVRAALERDVERFVFVSSPLVFERAELFPTPEEHLAECPPPRSAGGFARLAGERLCEAANREHGLPYAICRPFGAYGAPATDEREAELEALVAGPIEAALDGSAPPQLALAAQQTCAPAFAGDLAGAVVLALSAAAALNEDFNLGAARELKLRELARLAWEAAGGDPAALAAKRPPVKRAAAVKNGARGTARGAAKAAAGTAVEADLESAPGRCRPAVEKARELLGWQAQTELAQGLAATVEAIRERHTSADFMAAGQ
jgi:UDP-glucose 4-epimerase